MINLEFVLYSSCYLVLVDDWPHSESESPLLSSPKKKCVSPSILIMTNDKIQKHRPNHRPTEPVSAL